VVISTAWSQLCAGWMLTSMTPGSGVTFTELILGSKGGV
jgi:hypothetical protein